MSRMKNSSIIQKRATTSRSVVPKPWQCIWRCLELIYRCAPNEGDTERLILAIIGRRIILSWYETAWWDLFQINSGICEEWERNCLKCSASCVNVALLESEGGAIGLKKRCSRSWHWYLDYHLLTREHSLVHVDSNAKGLLVVLTAFPWNKEQNAEHER